MEILDKKDNKTKEKTSPWLLAILVVFLLLVLIYLNGMGVYDNNAWNKQ